jgi:hypothetical protein
MLRYVPYATDWIGAAKRAYRKHLGEEALVYRLAYNGDVVAFKMGRRQGKRVGGSAYWRIGVSGDAFSQRVAR